MKKPFVKRLASTILVLLMVLTYSGAILSQSSDVFGVTQSDLNNAKDDRDDTQKQLDETKKQIDELKNSSQDTQSYIDQLDAKVSELDGSIYETNAKISQLETEIGETEEKLSAAEENADQQYEAMKLRIQFMYEYNSENYISILLSSSSMGDLLNKAEYISKISEYDRKMLVEYEENIKFIANAKEQLVNDRDEMQAMKDDLEEKRQAVAYAQQTKIAQLQKLNTQLASAKDKEDKLHTDLAEQESSIKAMEEQMRQQEEEKPGSVGGGGTGQFVWPTISHRITSPYGDGEDRSSPHQGLDIGAVTPGVGGDPIYAADSGTVTISTFSSSAGNWIWVYHGNNLYTVYMHCSSRLVSEGDKVTKGQTIGLMGTTGNSTGVHLHFGVRLNGVYVNPNSYLY